MANLIPLPTWAAQHGITPGRARQLALAGRIPYAAKLGRGWYVPSDTPKPPPGQPGRPPKNEAPE